MRFLQKLLPERSVPFFPAMVTRGLLLWLCWSVITLPIMGAVWLGEIPPLALVQWPKIFAANWCRTDVVMPLIRELGWSSGSYSPDSIMARPWGLLAFHLPLLGWAVFVALRRAWGKRECVMGSLLALAVVADYVATLAWAGGPGFSIY